MSTSPFPPIESGRRPVEAPPVPANPFQPPQQPWAATGGPAPQPYQQPPEPPRPPGTNPWAITSLVTGLLALVPVAVPTGVVALVQTRRSRQNGAALAIGGLVASGAWLVVGLVGLVVWFASSGGVPGVTPLSLGPASSVDGADVGDCLDLPADSANPATPVPCASAHDAEVYLVWEMGGPADRSVEDVEWAADDRCFAAFESYVGQAYELSEYDYGLFSPDPEEWAAGERTATCVVLPWDSDVLRGPVAGSGR